MPQFPRSHPFASRHFAHSRAVAALRHRSGGEPPRRPGCPVAGDPKRSCAGGGLCAPREPTRGESPGYVLRSARSPVPHRGHGDPAHAVRPRVRRPRPGTPLSAVSATLPAWETPAPARYVLGMPYRGCVNKLASSPSFVTRIKPSLDRSRRPTVNNRASPGTRSMTRSADQDRDWWTTHPSACEPGSRRDEVGQAERRRPGFPASGDRPVSPIRSRSRGPLPPAPRESVPRIHDGWQSRPQPRPFAGVGHFRRSPRPGTISTRGHRVGGIGGTLAGPITKILGMTGRPCRQAACRRVRAAGRNAPSR